MSISFFSEPEVKLIDCMASDLNVTRSAQVSVKGENKPETDTPRLINYLMSARHGCYDRSTEVLTEHGWKTFPDYVRDYLNGKYYRVWTLNLENNIQELQLPERVIRKPFEGSLVHIKTQAVDIMVTPNHRMIAQKRVKGGWSPLSIEEADSFFDRSHRIHLVGGVRPGEVFLTPDEEELLGFIIADGNIQKDSPTVRFRLRKERKISWLKNRADVEDGNDDNYYLRNLSPHLVALAHQTYDESGDRVIPQSVLRLWGSDSVRRLLMGYIEGDGHQADSGKVTASTVSWKLVEHLTQAGLAAGIPIQHSYTNFDREGSFGDRPLHVVTIFRKRNSSPRIGWTTASREREVSLVPYSDDVFCATVANGTLYVRRNGKAAWCGNSPFEHSTFTWFVKAPIFVFREFHRHRAGWSYNEWSGRYSKLEPEFYIPSEDRPLVNIGTSARPEFASGGGELYLGMHESLIQSYEVSWDNYQKLLDAGVANEVARMVLPVGIMSQMYATCNARSLMHFLSLRTDDPGASIRSRPQLEIEMVARKMEKIFSEVMPFTYQAWIDNGRVAP